MTTNAQQVRFEFQASGRIAPDFNSLAWRIGYAKGFLAWQEAQGEDPYGLLSRTRQELQVLSDSLGNYRTRGARTVAFGNPGRWEGVCPSWFAGAQYFDRWETGEDGWVTYPETTF